MVDTFKPGKGKSRSRAKPKARAKSKTKGTTATPSTVGVDALPEPIQELVTALLPVVARFDDDAGNATHADHVALTRAAAVAMEAIDAPSTPARAMVLYEDVLSTFNAGRWEDDSEEYRAIQAAI